MKISIIIPAYNEEKYIERCLQSVWLSIDEAQHRGLEFEVIVSDNQSTDSTAQLAKSLAAKVVREPIRQISRVRNQGAKEATGDWLLFIDADSILHPRSLTAFIDCVSEKSPNLISTINSAYGSPYVGGGSIVGVDQAPGYGVLMFKTWNVISRITQCAAGSFVFCRADAFREVGGFSDNLFAGEEVDLTKKLKKWGKSKGLRFIILAKTPHISSGRKFRDYSFMEMLGQLLRILILNRLALRNRKHLQIFYEARR